jgi:phosphoheptose isomerase
MSWIADRRALPPAALLMDSSVLTYMESVYTHGRAGDVLVGIDKSGNSEYALRAQHAGQDFGTACIEETPVLAGHYFRGLAEDGPLA